MSKKNIALIGFMGSGKSMVSGRLGKMFNKVVISTDEEIEQRENRTILDIFKDSGEDYFRQVEKRVVQDIAQQDDIIIDCGGGVVVDQENLDNLKKKGIIIYLAASPRFLHKQIVGRKHRPLMNVEDPLAKIEELLNERKHLYEQADFIIDTDNKTVEEIAEDVKKILSNE